MYDDLINIRSFSIQIKLLLRGSGLTSSKKLSVIILLIAIHDGKDETTALGKIVLLCLTAEASSF